MTKKKCILNQKSGRNGLVQDALMQVRKKKCTAEERAFSSLMIFFCSDKSIPGSVKYKSSQILLVKKKKLFQYKIGHCFKRHSNKRGMLSSEKGGTCDAQDTTTKC